MATFQAKLARLCGIGFILGIFSASTFAGPTSQPANSGLDPRISAIVHDAVEGQTYWRSEVMGGAFTQHPFEDVSSDGVLVGFRLGVGAFFNAEVIKYVQPIYLTPHGERTGAGFGNPGEVERYETTEAPAGYAVGALNIRGGGGLDAVTVTFMKFNGTRLDPTDTAVSRTIGGGKNGGGVLDGDGTPVIGICGREGDNGKWLALGLIFVKPTPMLSETAAQQIVQRSDVRGGAFGNRPFEDVSQDGVLIGFKIGIGAFFNQDVIKWIAPIYLTPRGEEVGNGLGNEDQVERMAIAKAPKGYAVGSVSVRGGGGLDAITVTYMKFNGTRLDPTDLQVTPRIGGSGGGESVLSGDGTPIIGICGRQNDNGEGIGIGLIFVKPTAVVDARQ